MTSQTRSSSSQFAEWGRWFQQRWASKGLLTSGLTAGVEKEKEAWRDVEWTGVDQSGLDVGEGE